MKSFNRNQIMNRGVNEDIEVFKTTDGKIFAIKNIRVKQISNTQIGFIADMAGDLPSAEKYLKEKTDLMAKYLKEEIEKLK